MGFVSTIKLVFLMKLKEPKPKASTLEHNNVCTNTSGLT